MAEFQLTEKNDRIPTDRITEVAACHEWLNALPPTIMMSFMDTPYIEKSSGQTVFTYLMNYPNRLSYFAKKRTQV